MKSLLIATLLLSSTIAMAGSRIGTLAGMRYNNMTVENDPQSSSYVNTAGYQIGFLYLYSFLDTLSLRTGLIYTKRSADVGAQGYGTFKDNIIYTDIPLNVQLSFPATGFYVFGGLKYGIKQSSSCDDISQTGGICRLERSSTNIVLNLGPGYELVSLPTTTLSLEAEYEKGLTNIDTTPGSSAKNSTLGWAVNLVATFGL